MVVVEELGPGGVGIIVVGLCGWGGLGESIGHCCFVADVVVGGMGMCWVLVDRGVVGECWIWLMLIRVSRLRLDGRGVKMRVSMVGEGWLVLLLLIRRVDE